MIMQLAHELHIDEEEILTWPKDKFARWIAYFKVKAEHEKRPPRGGVKPGFKRPHNT